LRPEIKVSVLITCFNHERYIEAAVESALAQRTSFEFEVIACDDGSTDRTPEILQKIAARHSGRIRLLLEPVNLGQGGVEIFFRGMRLCRGRYVALLDGDDYWTDQSKLELQAAFMDAHPDCPMCFHNSEVRYDDGQLDAWPLYPVPLKERLWLEDLIEISSIHNSSVMFRPEILEGYREWCETIGPENLNDWTAAVVAARAGPLGYLHRVMAVYRQSPAGAWARLGRAGQLEAVIRRYEQADRFLNRQFHELIEKAICVRSYEASVEFEKQGDLESARRNLSRCLSGRPEWLSTYVAAHGVGVDKFRLLLNRRLWLYRHSLLFRLAARAGRIAAWSKWVLIKTIVLLGTPIRLARGTGFGLLVASPNPAPASARHPELGATTLRWYALGASHLEIRVGMPAGDLFLKAAGAASGAGKTGEWVRHGMLFYLQNVSGGRKLSLANTLDVVRVAVKRRKEKPSA